MQSSRHVQGTFSKKQLPKYCQYLRMIVILLTGSSSVFVKRKNVLQYCSTSEFVVALGVFRLCKFQFAAERLFGIFRSGDFFYIFSAHVVVSI